MLAERRAAMARGDGRDRPQSQAILRLQEPLDRRHLCRREVRRQDCELRCQAFGEHLPLGVGCRQEAMCGPNVTAMGESRLKGDAPDAAIPLDQEQVLQQMLGGRTAAAGHDDDEPAYVRLSQSRIEAKGDRRYVNTGLVDPGSHEQPVGGDNP